MNRELKHRHSRSTEYVKHCPAGASPDWILSVLGASWGRIPRWETLAGFSRLFLSIWERGCSLCPLNYNKPLPEDVCCCSHTPLNSPFKKTVPLFTTVTLHCHTGGGILLSLLKYPSLLLHIASLVLANVAPSSPSPLRPPLTLSSCPCAGSDGVSHFFHYIL